MKIAVLIALIASPAFAQDYGVRDSDTVPTPAVLSDTILDRDLEYFDGGTSRYETGGTYAWTFGENNGGETIPGTFTIGENATICITYDTGSQRCDMFVIAGERLVLLTEDGHRYPVRTIR